MNILLMVTVMLLMLTLMTTAKLETFRSSQILDNFFNHYMEVEERGFINKSAEDLYKVTKMSKKNKKASGKKVKAQPRLSLFKLTDKKLQKEKPDEWHQLVNALKRLTDTIYGQHPFYKEFLEKHPNAIEDLAVHLTKGIAALPDKQRKNIKASELANIPLKDPELDEFFYKMLLGAPYKDVLKPLKSTGEEADNDEDEENLQNESEEFSSPKGYYSLLDFITMKDSEGQVRVFLAPKDLLLALFRDPETVNEIIATRQQLYKAALDAESDKEITQLSGNFATQFQEQRDPSISANMLDFTVNKTNPKEYEKSSSAK